MNPAVVVIVFDVDAKLLRKRADLVVVNQVGIDKTFGAERNAGVILTAGSG